MAVELLMRPVGAAVFDQMIATNGVELVAQQNFTAANEAQDAALSAEYTPADFEGLAARPLTFDAHVADLLMLREGAVAAEGPALDAMMLAAAAHEDGDWIFADALADDGGQGPLARRLVRPAFARRMTAKAEALGDRFAVTAEMNMGRPCEGACTPTHPRNVGDALGQVDWVAAALTENAERLRRASATITPEWRFASVVGRPQSDAAGRCDMAWRGLVAVEGAPQRHLGAMSRDRSPARITFDVTRVEARPGQFDAVPDVIVTGRSQGIDILNASGDVDRRLTAPDAGDAVVAVAARPDEAAAVEKAAVDWPDAGEVAVEVSDLDLLGLRTGQTLAAAHEALTARGDVSSVYEMRAPADAPQVLGYQRAYAVGDGSEMLVLASYAPDRPVLALRRRMGFGDGPAPFDPIRAAVTAKYGAPDPAYDGDASVLACGAEETALIACATPLGQGPADAALRSVDGDTGTPDAAPFGGRIRGLPTMDVDQAGAIADCGPVVSYVEATPPVLGWSGFALSIADLDAIGAVAAALSAPEDPAAGFEIDF